MYALKVINNSYICNSINIGLDHHCVWMTKCVGRKNKKWFYLYIFNFALFYCSILGGVIYYGSLKRQ